MALNLQKILQGLEMKAYEIIIFGDVQGVSYRYFARREAKALGLSGHTENEHDGSVKIFVQGADEKLTDFIEWSKEGSPMATVSDVKISEVEVDNSLKGFEVK
jgi:acylphosphatase